MKYPRSWVEALSVSVWGSKRTSSGISEELKILDALSAIGALKDVPKPREFWECTSCGARAIPGTLIKHNRQELCPGERIHYREVEDENE
jgi:hypothetical protein